MNAKRASRFLGNPYSVFTDYSIFLSYFFSIHPANQADRSLLSPTQALNLRLHNHAQFNCAILISVSTQSVGAFINDIMGVVSEITIMPSLPSNSLLLIILHLFPRQSSQYKEVLICHIT